MGCIKSIYKKTSVSGYVHEMDQVELLKNGGVLGNSKPKKAHRQVSLIAFESNVELFQLTSEGFCLRKFVPDLVVEGVEVFELTIGMQLMIGNTLHEVTEIGKKCHEECPLANKPGACVLKKSIVYTRVLESGIVRVGDIIQY